VELGVEVEWRWEVIVMAMMVSVLM
jgi:hypothetical protein